MASSLIFMLHASCVQCCREQDPAWFRPILSLRAVIGEAPYINCIYLVRFKVLTATGIKTAIFWAVLCILVGTDRRFTGAYCFHHQGYESHRSDDRVRLGFIGLIVFICSIICVADLSSWL
jgi:hypothetical protein